MKIKGMQSEEGSSTVDDHLTVALDKPRMKHDNSSDLDVPEENVLKNGNGVHEVESETCEGQSNSSRSRNSPAEQEGHGDVSIVGQPLDFQLGTELPNNASSNNYWAGPPQEDNIFQNFQPMNHPSVPNYSLNNNNSFPVSFGSIGQPTSYMTNNHGQFSSPPGMHGMMGNVASLNGPLSNMGYQNSHTQNQRRAITAQHNYGQMNGKPMNARFPWTQQSGWPNTNQPAAMSPWTVALQQQKAVNRGSNMSTSLSSKKGQSNIPLNHGQQSLNNSLMSQKYNKRSSPVPVNLASGPTVKSTYAAASEDATYHSQGGDSMKMDSLQTQLLDIMKHNGQYESQGTQKVFGDGLEFNGDEVSGNPEQRAAVPAMNGSFTFPGYRPDRPERFSRKVFVGGLPPDIDEDEITSSFRRFGPVVVDWPHKAESKSYFPPKGYCFLLFQEEFSVQVLIDACLADDGKLYWCVTSPTMKDKPVQIRPWNLGDSDFVLDGSQPLDPRKTIFVGGVPRPLRALELATIIDRLYGGVCYAGIDTDPELKYPKGAGRVAFSNQQSYITAISARFVQLQHGDIDKRVEVKPYVLDDQFCDECQGARCNQKFAPFFCASVTCLQYYCEHCWATIHSRVGREYHKPLVKEGADRPRAVPFRWC
ncbi:cytoplasmic polyadenylation element-binding protein 2-like [Watersipora subatra]|uniref:cytoplasmic polyadenylation element-binding protein 2-like n=1 Tax=Watersipora subatra TaxID=2589382 RepID=UPI00355B38DA